MPPLPVIREADEEEDEENHSEPLLVDHAQHTKEEQSLSSKEEDDDDDHFQQQQQARPTSLFLILLQRYNQYMKASIGKDRGMKLLQWTLALLGTWLKMRRQRRQQQLTSSNNGKRPPPLPSVLEQGSLQLATALSWARYCSRLLDWPAALEAAWTNGWAIDKDNKKGGLQPTLGRWLALSMVAYYPTELLAFVHWMVPSLLDRPGVDKRTAERWSYISCRCWFVYLIVESLQCLLHYQQLQQAQRGTPGNEQIQKQERYAKLQLVRNALFVLPSLHWSFHDWDTKPWLQAQFVNLLMWIESIVCLAQ